MEVAAYGVSWENTARPGSSGRSFGTGSRPDSSHFRSKRVPTDRPFRLFFDTPHRA